jgi:predicted TIM-barrel fold metal-dependent hydrolase
MLIRTMGAERFVFGSGLPLRIPDNAMAKLDLTELTEDQRGLIEHRNAARFAAESSHRGTG